MKPTTLTLLITLALGHSFLHAQKAAENKKKGKPTPEKAAPTPPKVPPTGYTDTPFLPGDKWRVHDDTRPRPKVVTPGKQSTAPPKDAVILFDGTDLSGWINQKTGEPAQWLVKDGFFEVPPRDSGKGGTICTKENFGDVQLHIEFATPAKVESVSQGRGNSGVFFCGGKYELQILDSYKNKSYADGQASALYGYKPPLVNASRKPGEWQTYDIVFEAPEFDKDGKVTKKAAITVFHNGVLTHHREEYLGATGHKKVAQYVPHEKEGPICLQDHKNPTRFRNIWARRLDLDAHE
ncbi:MAG: DUF1080 domain-containing protein [Verrucomicrobiota bacterium]